MGNEKKARTIIKKTTTIGLGIEIVVKEGMVIKRERTIKRIYVSSIFHLVAEILI